MGMIPNVKVEIFKGRVKPFSRFAPKTLGKKKNSVRWKRTV
jgi:hypothetical protein